MQSHPELEESAKEACDVLVDVFEVLNGLPLAPADRDAFRRFARADLATKSERTHPDVQRAVWQKAFGTHLPESVKRRIGDPIWEGSDSTALTEPTARGAETRRALSLYERIPADIFIITVIEEEFESVLKAFEIDSRIAPNLTLRGGKYYTTRLERDALEELTVYITMIGEARNVPCVNVCRDIFERFDVGACILVGIAGGNQLKVKLGDVVGSLQIFDLEGGKSQKYFFNLLQRVQPRLVGYDPPIEIKRNIENLDPLKHDWHQRFKKCIELFRSVPVSKPINSKAWEAKPHFHRGTILVGEKVLADGSLPKTAKRLNDQALAIEMEGSGFASACKHCSIPWLDIRGISDFANPTKEDGWHIPASVAAATVTRLFLEKEYRKKTEELTY